VNRADGIRVEREDAMNVQHKSAYHEVHARSLRDPEGFWGETAREIDWIKPAEKIFDSTQGLYGRWFAGAIVNTCYNALDRHVEGGRADQLALIHDSPLTGRITKFTYAELLNEVKTLAGVMTDFGVTKGDRVIIYMPLVAEAVMAMLACARIGAVHSVVFGGFAAKELATRIDDAAPKLIASCRTNRCLTKRSSSQASSRWPASSCSDRSRPAN
jgi:propionyl-CoA synthetase